MINPLNTAHEVALKRVAFSLRSLDGREVLPPVSANRIRAPTRETRQPESSQSVLRVWLLSIYAVDSPPRKAMM